MATRFWVGGGSANTWAATGNTNWSATSGGANNASVPGASDVAVFDGGSGSGNSVLGTTTGVTGLECDGSTLGTGAYAGTLTHNTGVTLTLASGLAGAANTLRFSSSMTYTPASTSSLITLAHTSGTANIKCNGQKLWALTINGAGGTTQTLDTLLVNAGSNAILTVTSGIFDANGGAGGPYAVTACEINSSGSTTRSVILGGTVTIGGTVTSGQNIWAFGTITALTFTKNSANIVILSPASQITAIGFISGGLTYNNITINATTTKTFLNFTNTANTFANFSCGSGWNLSFGNGVIWTISNAFTLAGTPALPMLIGSPSLGNTTTISCPSGACTLSWGGVQGVTASGGATFTATNAFDFGANSGWSISPPADATITPPAGLIAAEARGTVTTGGSTTSVPTSAFSFAGLAATGVVSNQFAGRTIIFDGNTTTAGLRGAAATILASSTSNTPTFTVVTLPATPASGDTFTVL
jgi:hypothetical protein